MLKNLFTPEKIPLDLFGAKKTAQAKPNVAAQQPTQKGPQQKQPQEQSQQQPQTQEKTQPFDPVFGPIRPAARPTENRELEAMRLELMRLQTENANLRVEIERLKQSQSDIKRFQVLETS